MTLGKVLKFLDVFQTQYSRSDGGAWIGSGGKTRSGSVTPWQVLLMRVMGMTLNIFLTSHDSCQQLWVCVWKPIALKNL